VYGVNKMLVEEIPFHNLLSQSFPEYGLSSGSNRLDFMACEADDVFTTIDADFYVIVHEEEVTDG